MCNRITQWLVLCTKTSVKKQTGNIYSNCGLPLKVVDNDLANIFWDQQFLTDTNGSGQATIHFNTS